jgi:hypothetical protein
VAGEDVPADALHGVLASLERGELGDPLPLLAYIAGRELELDPDELNGALRRAALLRAAGGDPARPLGVDDRAVKALARDLFSEVRRAELGAALERLVEPARELPRIREALVVLLGDLDLAWRLCMLGLLAEELGDREG